MIIKIFKISTKEMWICKDKNAFIDFVEQETGMIFSKRLTIEKLMKYLPIEDYHYIK